MSNTKHTTGRCYGCGPTIPPCEQCRAKERLIAAAPDLLEACKTLLAAPDACECDGARAYRDDIRACDCCRAQELAETAIAKAEGR